METAIIGFVVLFAVVFLGLPLGYAMIGIGVGGFALQRGLMPALSMAGQQILDLATNYDLSVLPMFLLMGALVHRADLSDDLYRTCNAWLGHRRGGLAMATIGACGGFSAVCGSSLATAATMARIAVPPMRKFGYADSLGTAAVAAGGTIGILIPPSVPMVIYGIITQTDIGKLFIGGIIPGALMVLAYMLAVSVVVRLDPAAGPRGPAASWQERWAMLRRVWGVVVLFVMVLGGVYFGIWTPTEAAGAGAAGALLFTLVRRRLSWATLLDALVEAGQTTSAIFVVMFGALVFGNFLTLSGLLTELVDVITAAGLSNIGIVLAMCLIYILLGCVFESLGVMMLTIPVFFPVVLALGLDPVWFGIIVVIVIEIGLITPPIGMNVFVVKNVVGDVSLGTVFRGVAPFVAASAGVLLLVIYFPAIALWLARLM